MHLRYDSVVIDGRGLLEKRGTVDVKRRLGEGELRVPIVTSRLPETRWMDLTGWLK